MPLSPRALCRSIRRAVVSTFVGVVVLGATLGAPVVAFAQDATAPPTPSLKRAPAPILGYAVIFVLLAMVLVASLWPSKRGHQD